MPVPDGFNLCVQYYRQPTPPPEEWEEDLRHIKKLGFTAVQLRPQWAWHERREGVFGWDDLDRLLEITNRVGLKVLFKFFLESAPAWLYADYEAERVSPDGVPIRPRARGSFYLGGWMPCFDRPVVWEKACRFVAEAVLRYRDRPNLLGWHLWNEPRSRPFADCACPHSTAVYRQWLERTFGNIDHFNGLFGTAAAAWADLSPPPDISGYWDSWLWRTSRAHAVAGWIERLAELVRGLDPSRPLFCHVGFNTVLQPTFIDTSHDVLTSRAVDVFGTSLPHWTGDFHTFFHVDRSALFSNPACLDEAYLYSLQARWMAAVKDYFWINEIYGNSWNYMAADYSGDDIRFMLAATISEGARGIVIWQFKPERFSEESVTSGLVELDGADTGRSLAASAVCLAREKDPRAFDSWRPEKARAAIVFDFSADMYSEMEDAEDIRNTGTVCYRYKESVKGWYSLLWRLGLAVDFVPVEYLERIGSYDLVILPYLHLLDHDQSAILVSYVTRGGTLAADPGLAFRDRRAWVQPVRPGQGLERLFGCRELKLKAVAGPQPVEAFGLELSATRLLASLEKSGHGEDLSAGKGKLFASRAGAGRTFYFGFYPGVSYRDTGEANYLKLAERLVEEAGIGIPLAPGSPLVRVRRGTVEQGRPAAFVFNYEDTPAALAPGSLARGNYRCVLTGRKVDGSRICGLGPREVLFLVPEDY
ncbi:MAG: beta-galactosidase [Candidatus Glassbacteria bacterium]